jgi:hypothetical protein
MDSARVTILRDLLASTGWVARTRTFAGTLRSSTRTAGGLLLVGTPREEPWHLAAHLDEESRWSGVLEISPTLVRWHVPDGAPPHLAVTLQRLERAGRGETVFVVAEQEAPDPLLERVWDARKRGATVLSLDGGDAQLGQVAHESLTVTQADLVVPELSFDTVQHLVSVAAGDPDAGAGAASGRKGLRHRLAQALDTISGSGGQETGWR